MLELGVILVVSMMLERIPLESNMVEWSSIPSIVPLDWSTMFESSMILVELSTILESIILESMMFDASIMFGLMKLFSPKFVELKQLLLEIVKGFIELIPELIPEFIPEFIPELILVIVLVEPSFFRRFESLPKPGLL